MSYAGCGAVTVCFLFIAWLGLSSPALGDATAASASEPNGVEPEVYEALAERGEGRVYVLISLVGDPQWRYTGVDRTQAIHSRQERVLREFDPGEFELAYRFRTIPGLTGRVTLPGLRKLDASESVVSVGLDSTGTLSGVGAEAPYFEAVRAQEELGITGAGVTVAVLDSGIDSAHVDLETSIVGEYHFLGQRDDRHHRPCVRPHLPLLGRTSARRAVPGLRSGGSAGGRDARLRQRARVVPGHTVSTRRPAGAKRSKSEGFDVASGAPERRATAAIRQSTREPRRRPPSLNSFAASAASSSANDGRCITTRLASSGWALSRGPQRNSAHATVLAPRTSPARSHSRRRTSSVEPRTSPRIRKLVSS